MFSLNITPADNSIQIPEKPWCYFPQKIVKNWPESTARKFGIKYSHAKLNTVCKVTRKEHVNEAISRVKAFNNKGAPIVESVLRAAQKNGMKAGLNSENLYVKECFVGKGLGGKKIDIKARGKFGIRRSPITMLTVILEEKPLEEIARDSFRGKIPMVMAHHMRVSLFRQNADYDMVRLMTPLMTSQGRNQRRRQFKRLV